MKLSTHCHQALLNLTAAKLRSFLAILGILVGTAAVVALISCGQLATSKALEQFKALGTDLLSLSIFPKDAKVDIERGNKFINLCKAAKMDVSFITKRYFIKGFNSHAISISEEQAFKALDNLKYKNYKEDKWKEVKSENDFIKILKEALVA